ncbi:MAG: hypothetical protein ACREIW_00990 [Chthoniobacterales bacterium]
MSSKGRPRSRTAGRAKTRRQARDFDSEFDLVQNNGRVTLPALYPGTHLTRKQLAIFIVIALSLLFGGGAFFGRK